MWISLRWREDSDGDYTADAVPGDNTVDSARAVVGSGQVAAGNIVVAEHGIGAEEGHAHCIRQQDCCGRSGPWLSSGGATLPLPVFTKLLLSLWWMRRPTSEAILLIPMLRWRRMN